MPPRQAKGTNDMKTKERDELLIRLDERGENLSKRITCIIDKIDKIREENKRDSIQHVELKTNFVNHTKDHDKTMAIGIALMLSISGIVATVIATAL